MSKAIDHASRSHALLSASSAVRWLACTPSARLEEKFEDKGSPYAAEGTLAHEIAELKLRKYYTEAMAKSTFTRRLNKLKKQEHYQEEMLKHTDTYLEYLQEITLAMDSVPYVAVEKKVNFSSYVLEGFGTADCIIISKNTLYVNDFKYGKGVQVSAEDNPQMKLYALGAYLEYSFLYPIEKVHMSIVQPRLNSISEYEITIKELLQWGDEIKPIADKAFKGEGEFSPGDHCKFCKAKAVCRARADEYSALDDFHQMKPPLISNDEVGQILEKAQGLDSWVKALKDYALKESLKGNEIPGWKAVEGRGSRNFIDQDKAFKELQEKGIKEAMLFERVPLTIPKIEKQLGKKEFRELVEDAGLVQKSPGKPALAKSSDKRQAITNQVDAKDDFK
ncbi:MULTISPECIES: DUF2800 domain-containing protein [unclassified Oceanobacillus]|uniref:DUF2800 domain-containing protein n=1 Tax=unclassified Oceanobacillus TaxID=2630292 RepID=UPI001BED18C8|nr:MULTISPECIES: DUF2800 domain-containing protein [unclassified Oceanobacillus]MBT2599114.1 DUF2800 domain-containing protein [Oceanobacillus sp. ISL-74]MBT2652032.1 DUF2800 domain-containing protein [Oceanobacillus sp. ISL-73]